MVLHNLRNSSQCKSYIRCASGVPLVCLKCGLRCTLKVIVWMNVDTHDAVEWYPAESTASSRMSISTVSSSIHCIKQYPLYQTVSTVSSSIHCIKQYPLYQAVSTVSSTIHCIKQYPLYQAGYRYPLYPAVSTISSSIHCINQYPLYPAESTVSIVSYLMKLYIIQGMGDTNTNHFEVT